MAIINKKCGIEYYDRMHRIGYWITWAAIAIFVAVPLILSIVHGIYPSFSDLVLACGGIVVIFLPTGVAEMFAEVPVMGSSYYVSSEYTSRPTAVACTWIRPSSRRRGV